MEILALLPIFWCGIIPTSFTLPTLILASIGIICCRGGERGKRLDAPVLFILVATSVSFLSSMDKSLSLIGTYNFYAYGMVCTVMLCIVYFFAGCAKRERIESLMVFSGVVISVIAILQQFGYQITTGPNLINGRSVGTLGSPIALGSYLACILPFTIRKPWFPILVAGILLSQSRGAIVGGFVGCLTYAYLSDMIGRKIYWPTLGFVSIVTLLGVVFFDIGRFEIWKIAFKSFLDNPSIGTGPDTFQFAFIKMRTPEYISAISKHIYQVHAHNSVLQVACTTGILGLSAYALLVRDALKTPKVVHTSVLVTLFAVSMFNPISFDVLIVGAMTLGFMDVRKRPVPETAFWVARLLGVLILLFWCRLAYADFNFKIANRTKKEAYYLSAIKYNPCEMRYLKRYVGFLIEKKFTNRAENYSQKIIDCHPKHYSGYFYRGKSALEGNASRKKWAGAYLSKALKLFPTHPNYKRKLEGK